MLADKPWIIDAGRPAEAAGGARRRRGEGRRRLRHHDRALRDHLAPAARAGQRSPTSSARSSPARADEPGVFMESVHFLTKTVAGVPLRRPPWFFDVDEQGEGLSDVGTHLVDLVTWMLLSRPGHRPRKRRARSSPASRWPTVAEPRGLPARHRRSGLPAVPGRRDPRRQARLLLQHAGVVHAARRPCEAERAVGLRGGGRRRATPTSPSFAARGRASRFARIAEQNYRPELYVVPRDRRRRTCSAAVQKRVEALQDAIPGVGVVDLRGEVQMTIPDAIAPATRRTSAR